MPKIGIDPYTVGSDALHAHCRNLPHQNFIFLCGIHIFMDVLFLSRKPPPVSHTLHYFDRVYAHTARMSVWHRPSGWMAPLGFGSNSPRGMIAIKALDLTKRGVLLFDIATLDKACIPPRPRFF